MYLVIHAGRTFLLSGWVGRLAFAATALLAAFPASAQYFDSNPRSAAFKGDSPLVLVPVRVTNSKGLVVNGLPRDSFEILEDKVNQHIFSFSEEDVPVSIGFVFDLSGSMKSSLSDAKAALKTVLDAANPEDRALLDTVSTRPARVSGITNDFEKFPGQIMFAPAAGSTALIDTVYESLQQLKSAHNLRKGLVVISDGMDNHSRYSRAELIAEVLEADVQIYCISLNTASSYLKAMQTEEQRAGLALLGELSERTGGLQFVVRDQRGVSTASAAIGRALRSQYVIGYIPHSGATAGSWRTIKVRVSRAGLQAHSRTGYHTE